jgi:hypothetical protein
MNDLCKAINRRGTPKPDGLRWSADTGKPAACGRLAGQPRFTWLYVHIRLHSGVAMQQKPCPTGITTHNKKLKKWLVAEHKSIRVHNYIKNIVYEVGMIAHSCGVRSPRELNRSHARIVLENGTSVTLEEIYPCKSSVH